MNKLFLSFGFLLSASVALAMEVPQAQLAAPQGTLSELVASGRFNVAERVKKVVGKRNNKELIVLDLRNLGLTSIKGLPIIPGVQKIDISRNYLKDASEIADLAKNYPEVVALNLSRNEFESLPTEIGNLPLRFLSAAYNSLTNLPRNFGKGQLAKTLRRANLSHNRFEKFPFSICKKMKKLVEFKMRANSANPKRRATLAQEVVMSDEQKAKAQKFFAKKFKDARLKI